MKWILVTAYLAAPFGDEKPDMMRLVPFKQIFETSEGCVQMGEILKSGATKDMKLQYECIGYDDGSWF